MKPASEDRVAEYVLGSLSETDRQVMDLELAASPTLRAEVSRVAEALSIAKGIVPIAPSERTRIRLLATLRGPDRFQPFFQELSQLFDLPVEKLRPILALVDLPEAWELGPLPIIHLIHFQAGPKLAASDAGLVRLAAGATFPRHVHLGRESTVVLEGTMLDGDRLYRPGDLIEWPTGTTHTYHAGQERDLVLIVAHNGIAPA